MALKYTVKKSIKTSEYVIVCSINFDPYAATQNFPVQLDKALRDAICNEFDIDYPDIDNRVLLARLISLPKLAVSSDWTGAISPEDWAARNGTEVIIKGSFEVYIDTNYVSEKFYTINIDCTDGFVHFSS